MKKHNLFTCLMQIICVLLVVPVGTALGGPKEEKVEIHIIQGSGITDADVNKWIGNANEADKPQVKYVVTSHHVYGPNTPYDANKNDPCKINVWGMKINAWSITDSNVDPNVSAQWGNVVILVPGDGNNIKIKDSTLAHELNHVNGLDHNDTNGKPLKDPNNKMYPDNRDHGDGNGVHSCHRINTQLTDGQRNILRLSNVSFAQDVMSIGRGGEVYDDPCDVSVKFIDLNWTQFWMEWIGGQYMLHFTAQVGSLSFVEYSEIGFYIESDNNPMTGEPPEGLDYYLAFNPHYNEIIFQRYESDWGWTSLAPPEGMTHELAYANPDLNSPPFPVGVKLDIPLASFMTLSGSFAFKATATNYVERDFAPNEGLLRYSYPFVPIPGDLNLDNKVDMADLQLMSEQWPD